MKKVFQLIFIVICFSTCTHKPKEKVEDNATAPTNTPSVPTPKLTEQEQKEAFEKAVGTLNGSYFIKDYSLSNDIVTINYCKDFKDYKKISKTGRLTESEYKSYWGTGDAVEKALAGQPARILYKLPFVNHVILRLPVNGVNFIANVERKEIEAFTNLSLSSLSSDDWVKRYSDVFIYDKSKRATILQKFISVEK